MRRDVDSDAGFALPAVWALIYSGRLGAARQACEDAIAYARDRGSRYAVARISAPRALVSWRLGDLSSAESDAESVMAVDAAWGIPHAVCTAVLVLVQDRARRSRRAHGQALAALDLDPAVLEVTPNQIVREARATLLMAEGRPREALTELHDYARWEQARRAGDTGWRRCVALEGRARARRTR